MMRAPLGDQAYWDDSSKFLIADIVDRIETLKQPAGDPLYEPQYRFNLAKQNWHLLLTRYSRGDPIAELAQYFSPLLDAWEQSEALGQSVWTAQQQISRHSWALNLDHYIVCFWLVGIALALDIPDTQWQRLVALIGNEGEDTLLDRIIASRSPGRRMGTKLCHPKPYQRLLDAIHATPQQQPTLLAQFVSHWYKELNRPPKKGLSEDTAMYDRPYWYTYGNKKLHDSGYFGRWCVEAVAAVKALGLDDSQCLGHEHYPGDLLRPTGPSTHLQRASAEPAPVQQQAQPPAAPSTKRSLLSRLLGR